MNKRYALSEVTQRLTAVAMGRESAEVVIKGGKLVNVNTCEIISKTDVAITHGRIALVGDASHTIGEETQIIDAENLYITPGFMDGHIHVESSMMSVREYARSVIPHGTTAIFMDPHEIANVLGMDGIKLMMEDGRKAPFRVFLTIPSCVPAAPGFEDTGAMIGLKEIEEALKWKDTAGLGEMMNFPGVIYNDDNVHEELKATLREGKIITGHYSNIETGKGLNAYIASGARCCHESVTAEEALSKIRLGMYAQIREGSAWQDVKEAIKCITENSLDTRYVNLVSDDAHPYTLLNKGHMDYIVKRAIEEGVNPITAIQMATINVAQCFEMSQDLGSVSPGRFADILLISDLTKVKVEKVLINGQLVADKGRLLISVPKAAYSGNVKDTVKLAKKLEAADFEIRSPYKDINSLRTRIIEVREAKSGTYSIQCMMPVIDNSVSCDLSQDIIKAAVIERHKATGAIGKGFVKGFNLKEGAVASTVSHDAHNLLIMGTNDEDMALAGNTLAEMGGGMTVVKDGKILAVLPLPIAGLMSEDSSEVIAKKIKALEESWKVLGCNLTSPFMTMALLALAVLPELRLTNRGLVDTIKFQFVDLFV
jgi:adenine deaminase